MRILLNRKPVNGPWGGGNKFVISFCDFFRIRGHEVVHQFDNNIDAIFIQDPRYNEDVPISINEAIAYKNFKSDVKIIQRINECDARKNTDNMDSLLLECSKYIDKTVFVSNWMQSYFKDKGWHCSDNYVLINGVDKNHFYHDSKNKINNGKINIVTHHWSNHPMKGFDIYEKLDNLCSTTPNVTFTYIGRERGTFKNTKVIPPLFGESLGKELQKYDVYVSASRFDPGPNHIIESIACEIPTYSYKDGGGACEFVGESHIYESWESLKQLIIENNLVKNKTIARSWKECMSQLETIIL
jgi:hypothetical protein